MNEIFQSVSVVLVQTISQYLESNKRLVIPQLGAFIVKDAGSVVFSEMLKRDDGVLRGVLCAEGSSEIEAAGEIDRFVFEVRHALQRGEEYRLDGLGVLKPGPNETIAFVYAPRSESFFWHKPAAAATTPEPAAGVTIDLESPNISPSAKRNPDPYVKGLRYGKPTKSTAAYTYVDGKVGKRSDRFIWIALIAVFIALSAIAFGYFNSKDEEGAEPVETEIVEPQTDQTATE